MEFKAEGSPAAVAPQGSSGEQKVSGIIQCCEEQETHKISRACGQMFSPAGMGLR